MYEFTASNGHHVTISRHSMYLIGLLVVWELVWKGIALYKAGRNRQPVWFVLMLIINSVGVLEIIYLLFFQKKHKQN